MQGWKFNRRDLFAGVFAAGVFMAIFAASGEVLMPGVLAFFTAVATSCATRTYVDALRRRVADASGPSWDVELNKVRIGAISDADYAQIRLDVFTDRRTYAKQAWNCARVAFNFVSSLFYELPVIAFWTAAAAAVFFPEEAAKLIGWTNKASPDEIGAATIMAARVLVACSVLAAFACVAVGGKRYGFVNEFAEETAMRLRRKLSAAAEGSIVLVREVQGARIVNDERASLHHRA